MLKVFKKLNDVALCATFMEVIGVIVFVTFCSTVQNVHEFYYLATDFICKAFMVTFSLDVVFAVIIYELESREKLKKEYEEFVDELESKYNLTGDESHMLWRMSKGL